MAIFRPHTPRSQSLGKYTQPDAPTPAAPSQDPVPTQPEARQYDGPLYTERQNAILIMLHERSTVALININVTDLSPMISPRKSFLANLATHPRSGL